MSDFMKRFIVTALYMFIVWLAGWYVTQDPLWFYTTETGRIGFLVFLAADLVLLLLMAIL